MTNDRQPSADPCQGRHVAGPPTADGVPEVTAPARIDITREQLIPLADVPGRLPLTASGKKLSRSAVHRWITRGLGDVRLEYLQVGRRRCTSVEALQRFLERLTAARATGLKAAAAAVALRAPSHAAVRRAEQERATLALRELLRGTSA